MDARWLFKLIALGVLAAYALAITWNDGEFWPFSKFPMFSRAGRPWARSLVIEVSPQVAQGPLGDIWEKELPGKPFALHHYQINQDDLSAVVRSLKEPLNEEQATFLAQYFERVRGSRTLVLYRAYGRFRPDRSVRERLTPLAIIDASGVRNVITPPPPEPDAGSGDAGSAAQPTPEAGAP